ncbi:Deacylase-like protein [Pyrenophora tritici-repentis]|nr:Deacylase-like protein [Pyrenophora tritici-repentis]
MQLLSAIATTAVLAGSASAVNFTGDVVNGVPVIQGLNLADVPPQTVSKYYLRAGELNGGHPVHIPIMVARGTKESLETGKKLSLSGTIHGDELNPVRVVQRIFEQLQDQVATLNGTVIGIPTVNPMGIYLNQRNYFSSGASGSLTNVNRIFPGVAATEGGSGPQILAYNIWNHIWGNMSNVDVGIDLHTPSSGGETSLWCYSDFRLPYVERLAKLLQPDTLKIDPGEPGSIETTFIDYKIPSLTVEMGQAKVWNNSLIDRVVDYVNRVMVDLKITPSNTTVEPDLSKTYIITTFHDTSSQYGGFVERLVGVDEMVSKGQPIAHVRNPFGDILETLVAPENGRMFQSPRDPSIEPGGSVGQIAYNSTDPECSDGCILSGSGRRR